jgi:uncharacterized membrane protein
LSRRSFRLVSGKQQDVGALDSAEVTAKADGRSWLADTDCWLVLANHRLEPTIGENEVGVVMRADVRGGRLATQHMLVLAGAFGLLGRKRQDETVDVEELCWLGKNAVVQIFFVITVTLIVASVAMLIAPLTYQSWDYATSRDVWWQIDSLWEALIVSILAVFVVGLISLYVTVRHQLAGQGVGSLGARNAGTVGGLARALIVR